MLYTPGDVPLQPADALRTLTALTEMAQLRTLKLKLEQIRKKSRRGKYLELPNVKISSYC